MKPILLLGGTFDPIHHGHIQPALEIAELLDAEAIRLIPNKIPPHKSIPTTGDMHRIAMCNRVENAFNLFQVDKIELEKTGVSYSIETLIELRNQMPNQSICFVMGLDSLNSISTWHRWSELLDYVHIIVAKRSGYKKQLKPEVKAWLKRHQTKNADDLKNQPTGFVYIAKTSKLKISSTYIRKRLKNELDCRCLLPHDVYEYIRENNLYQNTSNGE